MTKWKFLVHAMCSLGGSPVLLAQTPHLTGTVDIDLPRGLLAGDLCVSNLPREDTLRFLLRNGLNVASIRDGKGDAVKFEGDYDGRLVGEGLEYTLPDSMPRPEKLCMAYTGAYPVYQKRDRVDDSKGLIAFNGRTVRATEQSKWYPVFYDADADWLYQDVTYQLRVTCRGCATIYLNGSRPRPGPTVTAQSAVPRPLLLLAGAFSQREVDGTRYLNSTISEAEAWEFGKRVTAIKRFYEAYLRIPYQDSITFLDLEPVRQLGARDNWAFTTWPTIAFAGRNVKEMLQSLQVGDDAGFLHHELAHYYFGSLRSPRGPYFWFFVESTTEFLALKALQHFGGDAMYQERLHKYYRDLGHFDEVSPVPLDRITAKDQMDQFYRYRYGPLLLVALEQEIGSERMGDLFHQLLTAPADLNLDYQTLTRSLRSLGVPTETWRRFEERCIHPAPAVSCVAAFADTSETGRTNRSR
jgi:hypothetical protein